MHSYIPLSVQAFSKNIYTHSQKGFEWFCILCRDMRQRNDKPSIPNTLTVIGVWNKQHHLDNLAVHILISLTPNYTLPMRVLHFFAWVSLNKGLYFTEGAMGKYIIWSPSRRGGNRCWHGPGTQPEENPPQLTVRNLWKRVHIQ